MTTPQTTPQTTQPYTLQAGGTQIGKTIRHTGTCDICRATNCPDIYDAALLVSFHQRRWAWCCDTCFKERNGTLGVGRGQHFTREEEALQDFLRSNTND